MKDTVKRGMNIFLKHSFVRSVQHTYIYIYINIKSAIGIETGKMEGREESYDIFEETRFLFLKLFKKKIYKQKNKKAKKKNL